MAVSPAYKLFVADLMAPFGEVCVRAMFGGGGIYHQGVMMGLIADEQIYLKADAENRPEFEALDQPPFIFERGDGRQIAMSFYLAPDEIFYDPDALIRWADGAFAAARRAAAGKKPKMPNKPKKRAG